MEDTGGRAEKWDAKQKITMKLSQSSPVKVKTLTFDSLSLNQLDWKVEYNLIERSSRLQMI